MYLNQIVAFMFLFCHYTTEAIPPPTTAQYDVDENAENDCLEEVAFLQTMLSTPLKKKEGNQNEVRNVIQKPTSNGESFENAFCVDKHANQEEISDYPRFNTRKTKNDVLTLDDLNGTLDYYTDNDSYDETGDLNRSSDIYVNNNNQVAENSNSNSNALFEDNELSNLTADGQQTNSVFFDDITEVEREAKNKNIKPDTRDTEEVKRQQPVIIESDNINPFSIKDYQQNH